jgi:hypothetical protein
MKSSRLQRLAICGLGVAALALAPMADEIRVTPVVADGHVSVSFSAPSALGPDARELVQSGLLMTLTFLVDLKQSSSAWFDRGIARVQLASSVKYDNLTGVYHVSRMREGHVVWSERTDDFVKARSWLTTFEHVRVLDADALQPNAEYYVRVRMRASPRRTFPLWPWASEDGSGRAVFTFIR